MTSLNSQMTSLNSQMTSLNSQMVEALKAVRSEIKVNGEGQVVMTKHGLSTLLGISHSVFNRDRIPRKLAEMLTDIGLGVRDLDNKNELLPEVIECIIYYYAFDAQKTSNIAKHIHRSYGRLGILVYMQEVSGFTYRPETALERIERVEKELHEYVAILRNASNKPGLQNILDTAIESDGYTLPGLITLDSELERLGLTATKSQKSDIGRKAREAYFNMTGKAPDKISCKRFNSKGRVYYPKLTIYSTDFRAVLENAILYVLNPLATS